MDCSIVIIIADQYYENYNCYHDGKYRIVGILLTRMC